MAHPSGWSGVLVLVLAAGCRTYEPAPLDPALVVRTVEEGRRVDAPVARMDLASAVAAARERSPSMLPVREAEATARTLAELDTPLPNPTVSVGGLLLSGADLTGGGRRGFETAAGWLLDVTGNRSAATDVREARSVAARVASVATERETYLAVRRSFTRLASAQRRREILVEMERGAVSSLRLVRRLVEAAHATALDVRDLEVERYRAAADAMAARELEDGAREELSVLTGLAQDVFAAVEEATIPDVVPVRDVLVSSLVHGHPELDGIRADHDVAEAELRAEIAAQFPGLQLMPGLEHEQGVDRYSLGFGFEVPLFDRNQLGIAAAQGRRGEIRARFESVVSVQLARIDGALARLRSRGERLAVLRDRAEPAARDARALAEAALRSGSSGALRYMTGVRTERSVRLDRIAAEQAVVEAWCDLEAACGVPLLQFSSTALKSDSDANGVPGGER